MGPVNMMALEEYKETAERHEFLDTQRKDLLDSIENTQKTIKEIEVVSRQKFEEAFAAINDELHRNLQQALRRRHGLHAPHRRGKRLRERHRRGRLASGQEAAERLAALRRREGADRLSLLVGIFQFAPSPFCILDEVDAPLDEANIGRFTQLVREMSARHAVHHHHPQQEDDEHRSGAVWRHHAGAGRFQAGLSAVQRE